MSAPLPPAYQRHFDWLRYIGAVAAVLLILTALWMVAILFSTLSHVFPNH